MPAAPPSLQRLKERYPALDDPALLAAIERVGIAARLPRGAPICELGQECGHLALVLEGRARVYELAESGREITLYRVEAGECCILTASCIMGGERFPAFARCEQNLEAVLIPAAQVEDFMLRHAAWRRFVWRLLASRLAGVLTLLEEVTFRRLDLTHQAIADDLGTSREVVSRVLKDLEQRGLLRLARGRIGIDDPQGLELALAQCD